MSWIFRSLSSPLAVGVAGVGYSQPVSSIICPQSTVSIRQHIGREYDHYTLTWAPVKIPNTHIIINIFYFYKKLNLKYLRTLFCSKRLMKWLYLLQKCNQYFSLSQSLTQFLVNVSMLPYPVSSGISS